MLIALTTITMGWVWIGVGLTVPTLAAFVVAAFIWRKGHIIIGNIVGSAVVLAVAVYLISREYAELMHARRVCAAAEMPCVFWPTDFTRYAIFAGIGFLDVMVLFAVSLWIEERLRARERAPEWR